MNVKNSDPASAWVNRSLPEESRILMAPLTVDAGGWGQTDHWASPNDPQFKQMKALVLASFTKRNNENDRSWLPSVEKGASEPWISADRDTYREWIKQNPVKQFSQSLTLGSVTS